ncbi:MAG: hypothetical protein ACON5A_01855 [Candidatus Comchoanobacterales bacterium]
MQSFFDFIALLLTTSYKGIKQLKTIVSSNDDASIIYHELQLICEIHGIDSIDKDCFCQHWQKFSHLIKFLVNVKSPPYMHKYKCIHFFENEKDFEFLGSDFVADLNVNYRIYTNPVLAYWVNMSKLLDTIELSAFEINDIDAIRDQQTSDGKTDLFFEDNMSTLQGMKSVAFRNACLNTVDIQSEDYLARVTESFLLVKTFLKFNKERKPLFINPYIDDLHCFYRFALHSGIEQINDSDLQVVMSARIDDYYGGLFFSLFELSPGNLSSFIKSLYSFYLDPHTSPKALSQFLYRLEPIMSYVLSLTKKLPDFNNDRFSNELNNGVYHLIQGMNLNSLFELKQLGKTDLYEFSLCNRELLKEHLPMFKCVNVSDLNSRIMHMMLINFFDFLSTSSLMNASLKTMVERAMVLLSHYISYDLSFEESKGAYECSHATKEKLLKSQSFWAMSQEITNPGSSKEQKNCF